MTTQAPTPQTFHTSLLQKEPPAIQTLLWLFGGFSLITAALHLIEPWATDWLVLVRQIVAIAQLACIVWQLLNGWLWIRRFANEPTVSRIMEKDERSSHSAPSPKRTNNSRLAIWFASGVLLTVASGAWSLSAGFLSPLWLSPFRWGLIALLLFMLATWRGRSLFLISAWLIVLDGVVLFYYFGFGAMILDGLGGVALLVVAYFFPPTVRTKG